MKELSRVRRIYSYIKVHRRQYPVHVPCDVLGVAPSGYYDWVKQPLSARALEDARLLRMITASYTVSKGVHGAPRVFLDLREAGETCSKHRVARVMRETASKPFMGTAPESGLSESLQSSSRTS